MPACCPEFWCGSPTRPRKLTQAFSRIHRALAGKLYPRAYTPPPESKDDNPPSSARAKAGKSPRETMTRDQSAKKLTPREAPKVVVEDDEGGYLKPGQYVGELGVLKSRKETTPLVAGPGLVALAADGAGLKSLLDLTPTFKAHVALRCVDSDRIGYEPVINYKEASEALLAHMKSEYADEAWHFEQQSSAWITSCNTATPAQLLETAKELQTTFIDSDTIQQINIPADCQKAIISTIESGTVSATLFDDARLEMKKLTERDTLPRFRKGDAFRELVSKLGRYPEAEQFKDMDAFESAINSSAQQAAAFPTYAHTTETAGDWRQYETDM